MTYELNLPNPYYTVRDIVEGTKLNRRRIEQEIEEGRLVPLNKPGHLRFSYEEVARWWKIYQMRCELRSSLASDGKISLKYIILSDYMVEAAELGVYFLD